MRREPSRMQGVPRTGPQGLFMRHTIMPEEWKSCMAHQRRRYSIPRWAHPVLHPGRQAPSFVTVALDHRSPTLYLSLQGIGGAFGSRRENQRRAYGQTTGGQSVLLSVSRSQCALRGGRKSLAPKDCPAPTSFMLYRPVLVRSQVHEEDTLLATESPSHHGRCG